MTHQNTFTNASEALPALAAQIMGYGDELGSRAGRVKELTHTHVVLTQPWQREILVPGRRVNFAAQIAETMWVLAGRNDVEWLGHYLPRAADFSDDGSTWRAGYGPRLRSWVSANRNGTSRPTLDQFAECYKLIKADPSTRRAVMSIWDPAVDYADSKDIPCNNWLSWSSRLGYLDLSVAIRSNDLIWGWSGINAFEWSVMQEVMAGLLGLRVGKLVFTQTSLHIYDRHWGKADELARVIPQSAFVTEALSTVDSPRFSFSEVGGLDRIASLDALIRRWFILEEEIRTGSDRYNGSIDVFPEPMMRSWLKVLQWWWGGDRENSLAGYEDTRLAIACEPAYSVQPPIRPAKASPVNPVPYSLLKGPVVSVSNQDTPPAHSPFIEQLCALHIEKEAAYAGSWKKRGELFSIIPNIARKVDRLGGGETADETSADTAGDLLVYLAKYRVWLDEQVDGSISRCWGDSNGASGANEVMLDLETSPVGVDLARLTAATEMSTDVLENQIQNRFGELADAVEKHEGISLRAIRVEALMPLAYVLARRLWEAEQEPPPPTLYLLLELAAEILREQNSTKIDGMKRVLRDHGEQRYSQVPDSKIPAVYADLLAVSRGGEYRGADVD